METKLKTINTTADDPPGRLYRYYSPRLNELGGTEQIEKKKDKESRKLVVRDFMSLNGVWECEEFPGDFFPVDLSIKRRYSGDDYGQPGVSRFICLELKCAENDNTLEKMRNGPCNGAFIPLHKIQNLGTATDFVCNYDRAGLVYIIEGERYYIPYPVLTNWTFPSQHPLRITAESPQPMRAKFLKEGNLALLISDLQCWHGIEPFLRYVENGWIDD